MGYTALYNKYRPQSFEDVVGQEVVVKTLQKMIESDRIANGYLFIGDRGLGKTTLAKIFSKAINCTGDGDKPCNECPSCKAINSDSSFDMVELDAASNRGVDTIRDVIINRVQYKPHGKYKVYIVDECHMLTTEAWNALLKTLETPPPYVVFIFCTTNPEKIPKTIISRLQVHYLKNINNDDIVKRLKYICKKEGFEADTEALYSIARYAKGGMRDSISALDQISAFTNEITQNDVLSILGMISETECSNVFFHLLSHDYVSYMNDISDIIADNKDVMEAYNMVSIMTRIAVNVSVGNKEVPSDISRETYDVLVEKLDGVSYSDLTYLVELLVDNEQNMKYSYDKSLVMMSVFSKYAKCDGKKVKKAESLSDYSLRDLLQRVEALEKGNGSFSVKKNDPVSSIREKLNEKEETDDIKCDEDIDESTLDKAKQIKRWFKGNKK